MSISGWPIKLVQRSYMSRRLIIFCLLWGLIQPVWADGIIQLILSEPGAAHQEAADAFRAGIGSRRASKVWLLSELTPSQIQNLSRGTDLLVPIGVKAARFVAEHHAGQASVLSLMVPRAVGERLQWSAALARKKASYVYIDQPVSRSLGLVEAAFPAARRIGVVLSPENANVSRLLAQEATRRHLVLNQETVASPEEVAPALRRVLPESDVLLLVPDSLAINASNAQNVLLTTYRYRVPVLGFSQGLAKAGAVAAVYSSPGQIGRQGAQMALRWQPESGELPASQHAEEFSVAFNRHVARSLDVNLADEDEIARKLGAKNE